MPFAPVHGMGILQDVELDSYCKPKNHLPAHYFTVEDLSII